MCKKEKDNGLLERFWMFTILVSFGELIAWLCFSAHLLRGLNEIFDPSKATSARQRKLGLRPQTCAFAPWDAPLGQDGCPKIS